VAVFSADDLLHPFDESARRELESMADLPAAVRVFIRICSDREARDFPRSECQRLGPDRLPDVYQLLPPICAAFGIPEPGLYLEPDEYVEPELFVAADGMHAHAVGVGRTSIMITGELLDLLGTDERQAVFAHECGHILLSHVLYHSMSRFLDAAHDLSAYEPVPGVPRLLALATQPLRTSLDNWSSKSELSADRAAAAYLGSADAMTRAMFRFAATTMDPAGLHSVQSPPFARPSDPSLAIRVREIQAWTATPGFARLYRATPAATG
jgi:Zn-dependent protease with chaperone function